MYWKVHSGYVSANCHIRSVSGFHIWAVSTCSLSIVYPPDTIRVSRICYRYVPGYIFIYFQICHLFTCLYLSYFNVFIVMFCPPTFIIAALAVYLTYRVNSRLLNTKSLRKNHRGANQGYWPKYAKKKHTFTYFSIPLVKKLPVNSLHSVRMCQQPLTILSIKAAFFPFLVCGLRILFWPLRSIYLKRSSTTTGQKLFLCNALIYIDSGPCFDHPPTYDPILSTHTYLWPLGVLMNTFAYQNQTYIQ